MGSIITVCEPCSQGKHDECQGPEGITRDEHDRTVICICDCNQKQKSTHEKLVEICKEYPRIFNKEFQIEVHGRVIDGSLDEVEPKVAHIPSVLNSGKELDVCICGEPKQAHVLVNSTIGEFGECETTGCVRYTNYR